MFRESDRLTLGRLERKLNCLLDDMERLMHTLDELIALVTDANTQTDSLITLLAGIKAQLDAALAGALTPAQQAKVDEIFAAVAAQKTEVVDAINANTPQAGT